VEQIATVHGWQIVAKEVMPDHVRLFVRVGPTEAPAAVVRAFKGRTARVLGDEFPYLRRFVKVLWSPSYLAASVGYVWESTVRCYIEHQWDAVVSCDAPMCFGCARPRASTLRWRRVWKSTASSITRRCRSAGVPGRQA